MSIQSFGPFRLNRSQRIIEKNGERIIVGGRALDLLIALIDRAGAIVSARELMALIWPDVIVEEANLRVSISALRKALGEGTNGARYIVNVPGRGYTFVAPLGTGHAEGCISETGGRSLVRSCPLPDNPEFLVGRHDIVNNLSRLVVSQRFVTVVGPGGIGKTTVSLAVASALGSEFGDGGTCFVDASVIDDPDDLPNAVASALGCPALESDPLPAICAFLAEKRTLLILDSCEHIIEAAASLAEHLFHSTQTVHLLTTSRERLRVHGENVYILPPLHYPVDETPTAHQAMATPAVQLFMEKAAASGYRENLSDNDAPIVSSICRRLDGIALAIELVASRVGIYGIHGTVDLLDSGAELGLQGRRGAAPRHQTLRALYDWSYDLLSPKEQTVLARLSVFVDELTLEAAHAVVGDNLDDRKTIAEVITSLADKSLIQVSSAEGAAKYRLVEATRAYALLKLADRGEEHEMARRHALYFTSVLEKIANQGTLISDRDVACVARSIGEIRRAMAWSFSRDGDSSIGRRMTASASHLSSSHALLPEWCQHAPEGLRKADWAASVGLDLKQSLEMSVMYSQTNGGQSHSVARRGFQLA